MITPLRFALIGCGSIAPTHARALAALPDADLVACADVLPERAQVFAAEFGLRAVPWAEILADPAVDAVTVCAPSGLHARLGVEALRAGKHVVVEKPMDISLAACDALIAAQTGTGRALAVISQHRFDQAAQVVLRALGDGLLGDLFLVDARIPWYRTQEYYASGDWRGTWAMDGGGCLINQGVHTVDLMRWLAGSVKSIYAQARTAAHTGIAVEDALAATLTFASGALGTLMASTAAYPGFPARLALHGTRGSAIIEGDALHTLAIQGRETLVGEDAVGHAVQVATGGTRAASNPAPPELGAGGVSEAGGTSGAWGDAHREQLADFIHCCRTGETPLVDGPEGRQAVEVVLAAYESARTNQPVFLTGEPT